MTKEQIDKAVNEYIGYPSEMDEGIETTMRRNAFKDGADWRINSAWHKPEEVPEEGKSILTINNTALEYDKVGTRITNPPAYWPLDIEFGDIIRWAYIKDLIPTEDERDS